MILVCEFHFHDKLVKGLNYTFITLIPKVHAPQRLVDCIYKVLVKILDNRLKKVIGNVTLESRPTFVKGGKFWMLFALLMRFPKGNE